VIYSISDSKRGILTKNPDLMKQLIDTIFQVIASSKTA